MRFGATISFAVAFPAKRDTATAASVGYGSVSADPQQPIDACLHVDDLLMCRTDRWSEANPLASAGVIKPWKASRRRRVSAGRSPWDALPLSGHAATLRRRPTTIT
jgi:hypothetical protein